MLTLQNVGIEIHGSRNHVITPVRDVSFHAAEGEITAIVGESGSGKTLTALAIMRLLQEDRMNVVAGSKIDYKGQNLLDLPNNEMCSLRGKELAMIFQNPGSSLNPILSVGKQLSEPLMWHAGLSKKQAWIRAMELLDDVGIKLPSKRLKAYPHELSGGQQQRIMIAMAVAVEPSLIIADEPTSALDVTIQRQIIDLIMRMKEERNLSILFISHDLAMVADIADRIVVMSNGVVVEEGDSNKVLRIPKHLYTRSLIEARLTIEKTHGHGNGDLEMNMHRKSTQEAVIEKDHPNGVRLEAKGLCKRYWLRSGFRQKQALEAVRDISFELRKGETVGVVGESGSGKTTLAMLLMRLVEPTSGSIILDGKLVNDISLKAFRPMRRKIQMIFQNPYASFNPRWKIQEALT
ncbi:MAG: ABC transporter ATP-binding protein, partial [Candidatus Thiodiazotropha sp.]